LLLHEAKQQTKHTAMKLSTCYVTST